MIFFIMTKKSLSFGVWDHIRFDVQIPSGSRQIVLVCDDMQDRSPYNLGNWVEAGFCTGIK
jgi:hypothetical protein